MIWVERFIAIAVFLQAFEILLLRRRLGRLDPWAWKHEGPLITLTAVAMMLAALWSLQWGGVLAVAVMTVGVWVIAIRFRGTFNGGADSMTFYILNALLLGRLFIDLRGQIQIYIAALISFSYFIAGLSKLNSAVWREGAALPRFFKYSNAVFPRPVFEPLKASPALMRALSWSVILFECLFPLVLLIPDLRLAFLGLGVIFHIANFYVFGLNRFVFAWLAGYPAIYLLGR